VGRKHIDPYCEFSPIEGRPGALISMTVGAVGIVVSTPPSDHEGRLSPSQLVTVVTAIPSEIFVTECFGGSRATMEPRFLGSNGRPI
jgi:hypothetical protein